MSQIGSETFYIVKIHKIANNSTIAEAGEKRRRFVIL
jgi:hypothetical protein